MIHDAMASSAEFPQSAYPVMEAVVIGGDLVWRVSGQGGIAVYSKVGKRALETYWALCRANGLPVPG